MQQETRTLNITVCNYNILIPFAMFFLKLLAKKYDSLNSSDSSIRNKVPNNVFSFVQL